MQIFSVFICVIMPVLGQIWCIFSWADRCLQDLHVTFGRSSNLSFFGFVSFFDALSFVSSKY
jgi:hypothetical protein